MDGLALLMVEVSSDRSTGEKQSRVRSGPEEVTEAVETLTAIGGWALLIFSLIQIILPQKKPTKYSLSSPLFQRGSSI